VDVPEAKLRLGLRRPGGSSVISRLADVDVLCVQSSAHGLTNPDRLQVKNQMEAVRVDDGRSHRAVVTGEEQEVWAEPSPGALAVSVRDRGADRIPIRRSPDRGCRRYAGAMSDS
jgi:hypothetical protein